MKTYYHSINFLRGLAALLVCLYHFIAYSDFRGHLFSPESTIVSLAKFGANGVFIFFVVSGFVIPLSLFKSDFRLTQFHPAGRQTRHFFVRRFIRIQIPYMVSILLFLFVGFLFAMKNNLNFSINPEQFIYHIFYIIPFSKMEWYNIIYWTLAIEIQFYIIIGLLYFLITSNNKLIQYNFLVLFGVSAFIITDNRLVFCYIPIFLMGIILFLIKSEKINPIIGFVLIGCCTLSTVYLHSLEIAGFSLLTILVIQFYERSSVLTNYFGDICYSLYLTHGLIGGNILYFLSRYTNNYSAKFFLILLALGASILFSRFYWKFVEKPAKILSKKVIFSLNLKKSKT